MHHGTVLVVEDDDGVREALQSALEDEGYRVATAKNGREALDHIVEKGRPCLILLDMMMPVMNGWDFLAALKSNQIAAGTPVLIVSAAAALPSSGVIGALKKPIELDAILAKTHECC